MYNHPDKSLSSVDTLFTLEIALRSDFLSKKVSAELVPEDHLKLRVSELDETSDCCSGSTVFLL